MQSQVSIRSHKFLYVFNPHLRKDLPPHKQPGKDTNLQLPTGRSGRGFVSTQHFRFFFQVDRQCVSCSLYRLRILFKDFLLLELYPWVFKGSRDQGLMFLLDQGRDQSLVFFVNLYSTVQKIPLMPAMCIWFTL